LINPGETLEKERGLLVSPLIFCRNFDQRWNLDETQDIGLMTIEYLFAKIAKSELGLICGREEQPLIGEPKGVRDQPVHRPVFLNRCATPVYE
jgi:hypothetical protein